MRGLLSAAVLLGAYGGFRKEEVIGLGTDKMLDAGFPVVQVPNRMRHKRLSINLETYCDPNDKKIGDLGEAFREAVCRDF